MTQILHKVFGACLLDILELAHNTPRSLLRFELPPVDTTKLELQNLVVMLPPEVRIFEKRSLGSQGEATLFEAYQLLVKYRSLWPQGFSADVFDETNAYGDYFAGHARLASRD